MCAQVLNGEASRRLDQRLALWQSQGRIPSVVEAVVRDGGVVWSGACGSFPDGVDPVRLRYRIGSITKTFVAVVVMRLRDAGRLRLDDRVERFVPGTAVGGATVGQLLSHTGGVAAELPGSWWERSPGVQWPQVADSAVMMGAAGGGHHYSNVGFAVLGEVVSRLCGRAWHEEVAASVLAPLGMVDTSVVADGVCASGLAVHPFADVVMPEVVHDTAAMGAAGQLWSSVADLARWACFVAGDTGEVLSPDTLAQMRHPVTVVDGPQWTAGQGLGFQVWRRGGRRLVGHGGSMPGFQAGLTVDEQSGCAVVSVLNCTTPSVPSDVTQVLDIVAQWDPPAVVPWTALPGVDAGLLEVTGMWLWGTSQVVVRVERDGGLRVEAVSGMASSSRFRPNGDGTFTGCQGYYRGELLRVVRDDDGAVSHLDIGTFVFTRAPYQPSAVVPGGVVRPWPET